MKELQFKNHKIANKNSQKGFKKYCSKKKLLESITQKRVVIANEQKD